VTYLYKDWEENDKRLRETQAMRKRKLKEDTRAKEAHRKQYEKLKEEFENE